MQEISDKRTLSLSSLSLGKQAINQLTVQVIGYAVPTGTISFRVGLTIAFPFGSPTGGVTAETAVKAAARAENIAKDLILWMCDVLSG